MKLGRNEPCHCGSGKKYKKCCLESDNEFSFGSVFDDEDWTPPTRYLGYKNAMTQQDILGGSNPEDCIAVLNQVTDESLDDLTAYNITEKDLGKWLLTTGSCEYIKAYPLFETLEKAFDAGRTELGIESWRQ